MKMRAVRMSIILLAFMFVFLTACSGNSASNNSANNGSSSGGSNTKVSSGQNNGKDNSLYVIKVFADSTVTSRIKKFSDTPIGKVIKDKFNIDFQFVPYPPGNNVKQNWNLMLAGGNYPQIIYSKCECNDVFKKYVQAGDVIQLDKYLKEMPNFQKLYKKSIPYWKLNTGGKLYNWDSFLPQDKENWLEHNDILIRGDILQEAGYPTPPKLLTEDQYVKLLADAIKKHPTTNGKKTIVMVAPFGESWGMAGIAPILYEKGYDVQVANAAVIWNQKSEKWEDMFLNPYTKESFQFLNKLYRAGALDPESFTDKSAQVQEKLNSGRALAAWYVTWFQGSANQALEKSNHQNLEYVSLPIMSKGAVENGEKYWTPLQSTRPFDRVWITNKAKHPERIIQLLDWASSDEGQILLQSGIKGVHYTIKDGKRVPTKAYLDGMKNDPNYGIKQGFGLVPFLGDAMMNSPSDNQPYNMMNFPSLKDRNLTAREREIYKGMGWKTSGDWWLKNAKAVPTGLAAGMSVDPTSQYGVLEQRLTDFRVKNTAKLIKASSDADFEQIYNQLVAEYKKMNPQKLVDEYNRMYQEEEKKLKQYQ